MNAQINVRMSENLLKASKKYSEKHGYANIQDFIRETVREKVFEEALISKLIKHFDDKKLYGTEKELMEKLN